MIQDRLDKIEEKLKQSKALKEEDRAELMNLLASLRTEMSELSKTHNEQAESIAGFAELSAHEATRSQKSQELFDLSIEGLMSSVQGFDISHPTLVGVVNRLCTMLANMGI